MSAGNPNNPATYPAEGVSPWDGPLGNYIDQGDIAATSSAQGSSLQKSANLSDVASAAAARASLGLGTAAVAAIDTTAADIAMNGVPSAGSKGKVADAGHVHPTDTSRAPTSRQVVAGAGLTGGGDLTADRTISMPNVGTAGTVGDASHSLAVTTDAQGRVTGVAANGIQIAESQVTGLPTDLAAKAPLVSPTFTGTVTIPAPVNPTDAATKQYVDAASGVPGTYAPASPGKNLFDYTTVTNNAYWNNQASGVPYPVTGWFASAKIPVTVGTTYSVNNTRQVEFFNGSTVVTSLWHDDATFSPYTFTVPAGVTHVGLSTVNANLNTLQLEVGSSCTTYEPYGIRVPRQLSGGQYLDDRLTGVDAETAADSRLSGVRVYRSGTDFLIRSERADGQHLCIPVSLAYSSENVVSFTTTSNPFVFLVPAATPDSQVFPAKSSTVGTSIQGAADDCCPINVQWTYTGGAHGPLGASTVTMTGHGKTTADLGSQWSDGTRTYTLIRIVDANNVLMGHSYSVASGVVTGSTIAPAATLTHVSGATNTAPITISGGVALTEMHPFSRNHVTQVLLDGRAVPTGKSYGQVLTITESYDIMSFKSFIDWSRANIGSDPFANFASMTGLARIDNTYKFAQGTVVVAQRVTALEALNINMGVTQAIPLTIYSGWSRKQFMPGIGTAGGVNFSTLADLSTMTADIDITPAAYLDPLNPATRMVQWAYDNTGTPQYGLEVGILPVQDGHPSQRVKNAASKTWFISNSYKKNYPQIAFNKNMQIGDTLAGTGYRAYLSAPDTTAEVVISDGSDTYVFLDRPATTTTAAKMLAPTLLGKRLTPVEKLRVSGVPDRVLADGISYAVASAPGSGGWKAVDDKQLAPAAIGGAKTVGDYFTYPGVKTTWTPTGSYQILYLFPMTLPEDTPVDRVILDCSVLGTGVLRHGVYAHDPKTGQPVAAAPIADFGTLDITSTGIKGDSSLASTVWLPQVFWYGVVWQTNNTTAPTIRAFTLPVGSMGQPIDLGSTPPVSSAVSRLGYYMSGVTGALGALTGLSTHSVTPPAVIFRRAAS